MDTGTGRILQGLAIQFKRPKHCTIPLPLPSSACSSSDLRFALDARVAAVVKYFIDCCVECTAFDDNVVLLKASWIRNIPLRVGEKAIGDELRFGCMNSLLLRIQFGTNLHAAYAHFLVFGTD